MLLFAHIPQDSERVWELYCARIADVALVAPPECLLSCFFSCEAASAPLIAATAVLSRDDLLWRDKALRMLRAHLCLLRNMRRPEHFPRRPPEVVHEFQNGVQSVQVSSSSSFFFAVSFVLFDSSTHLSSPLHDAPLSHALFFFGCCSCVLSSLFFPVFS